MRKCVTAKLIALLCMMPVIAMAKIGQIWCVPDGIPHRFYAILEANGVAAPGQDFLTITYDSNDNVVNEIQTSAFHNAPDNRVYYFDITIADTLTYGDYTMKFKGKNLDQKLMAYILKIHVVPVAVTGITFINTDRPGNSVWVQDYKSIYQSGSNGDYEWDYGRSPILGSYAAYPQNFGPVHISVQIEGAALLGNAHVLLRAKNTGLLGGVDANVYQPFILNGTGYATSLNMSIHDQIENGVCKYKGTWEWEYSIDNGQTWASTTKSVHIIYVTYKNPIQMSTGTRLDNRGTNVPVYEHEWWQLYDISCSAINRIAVTDTDALYPLWALFRTKTIPSLFPVDKNRFPNYKYYSVEYELEDWSTSSLLMNGHGRCGNFSRFLQDLAAVQGIMLLDNPIAVDDTLNIPAGIPATYKRDSFIAPKESQGGNSQRLHFKDHALVGYTLNAFDVLLYDPSYGIPNSDVGYSSICIWEDFAFMDVRNTYYIYKSTQNNQPDRYSANQIFTQEITNVAP